MFQKDEYCILILGLDNAGKTVKSESKVITNLMSIKGLFILKAFFPSTFRYKCTGIHIQYIIHLSIYVYLHTLITMVVIAFIYHLMAGYIRICCYSSKYLWLHASTNICLSLQTFLEQTKTKFSKNYKGMNLSKITTTVGLNSMATFKQALKADYSSVPSALVWRLSSFFYSRYNRRRQSSSNVLGSGRAGRAPVSLGQSLLIDLFFKVIDCEHNQGLVVFWGGLSLFMSPYLSSSSVLCWVSRSDLCDRFHWWRASVWVKGCFWWGSHSGQSSQMEGQLTTESSSPADKMISSDALEGVPLLVLANKQDVPVH